MVRNLQTKARIFLVDDHPMVRERLGQIINHETDLAVCGESAGSAQTLVEIGLASPDLIVTDISLKDLHGLELIKEIKALHPAMLILVVSMHDESLYAERVLRAGARGYITKQQATTKILLAIRRVLSGEVYLSEEQIGKLLNRTVVGEPFGASPLDALADRELEVFQMIGQGLSTRQIAEELQIGTKTVESYRGRIKDKLKIETGADLTRHAIQWANGLEGNNTQLRNNRNR